eukprot:12475791-Alexandrium_andersonii.AAC.1
MSASDSEASGLEFQHPDFMFSAFPQEGGRERLPKAVLGSSSPRGLPPPGPPPKALPAHAGC